MSKTPEDLRISSTVYSWVMPETERLLKQLKVEPEHRAELRPRHREAWTGKQDAYHESFFEKWLEWSAPAIERPTGEYMYPCNGSSEAIRESLARHASLANYRPHQGPPTIHVFEGEYEGYEALAKPYGIRVVKHDRSQYLYNSIGSYMEQNHTDLEGDLFYISQPSSIDGNRWDGFSSFLNYMAENTKAKVMLDLCYVGTYRDNNDLFDGKIPAGHEAVDTVFFSLSKVFGLYYHRIGGMITHTEHPGLWGNKWFKNLTSLYTGERFMNRYEVFDLPTKYHGLREEVLDEATEALDLPHTATPVDSDVFLLAHSGVGIFQVNNNQWLKTYRRTQPQTGKQRLRFCLTQRLYEKAQDKGLYDAM